MTQVRMSIAGVPVGGTIRTEYSGVLAAGADATVTVDSRDAVNLLTMGARYVSSTTRSQTITNPRASSAGRIVASAPLSDGTLTVANQPDTARQCLVTVNPGSTDVTSGVITVSYIANDGTSQTDTIPAATSGATPNSARTSKAVLQMNSVSVSGTEGGTSPRVQIDDTDALGLLLDAGFADLNVIAARAGTAVDTGATADPLSGCVTPGTPPNGSTSYSYIYTSAA
jgi:hypothetical protein